MTKVVEFEGKQHEFPDDASDGEVADALERGSEKTLFSLEGMKSTLKMVGPQLVKGIVGHQLSSLEEIQSARERARAAGEQVDDKDEPDTLQTIEQYRSVLKEADDHIAKIRGNPSKPLEVAQGVVGSVAQNAPGIAAAVASRNLGTIATAPALEAAHDLSKGTAYADARIGKDASQEDSLRHANISGMTEASFELLPTSWLIKNLGKTGALEFAAKYIGRELATELPTTAVQKISERFNIEPEKPLGEFMSELGKELVDTALITPFAAGMTSLGARATASAGRTFSAPLETPKIDALDLRGNGVDNSDLSAPTAPVEQPPAPVFDKPTTDLDSTSKEQVQALIQQLDAELIDDSQVAEAKAVVQKFEEASKAPAKPEYVQAWGGLQAAPVMDEDAGELGASPKKAANYDKYPNPNTGDRLDRQFSLSTEPTYVGLTPKQVPVVPGTHVLGQPTLDRQADYLQSYMETIEQWRQKWMPNATFIVSNEALMNAVALGSYKNLGPGIHMIVPAVLRNPSRGLAQFNSNDQASSFYNATHEFAHGLVEERFFTGVSPEAAIQATLEAQAGVVSEQALAMFPEETQAVIREFNAIKERILNNQMTAEEFADTWFSPGKLGRNFLGKLKIAPTDNALSVVKALARQAAAKKNIKDGSKSAAVRDQAVKDFLGLDEYLAEQMARYAYVAKLDQKTPLGRFFKGALDSLRKFFLSAKGDGYIKPGTAFTSWVEGLSKSDRSLTEGERTVAAKKQGGTPKKKEAAPKTKAAAKPKKKVETVQHNIETDTEEGKRKKAASSIATLIRGGILEQSDPQVKELREYARDGDWAEFQDLYSSLSGKAVKFELDASDPTEVKEFADLENVARAGIIEEMANDPQLRAQAEAAWQKQQFRSPFFKAWFGDWENDPISASKIRRGAIIETEYHLKTMDTAQQAEATSDNRDFGGEPLVVYHATMIQKQYGGREPTDPSTNAFERFNAGDIGFHFGTVKAAHDRVNWHPPEQDESGAPTDPYLDAKIHEGKYIFPVVLNIRNPIYVARDAGNWTAPNEVRRSLTHTGKFTPEELYDAENAANQIAQTNLDFAASYAQLAYKRMEPFRTLLMNKGYDGIIYKNDTEDPGSFSFIALYANQIKSVLGSRTFSRSDNMHMELDLDGSQEADLGMKKIWTGVKDFATDFPRMRRAMRYTKNALASKVLELQQMAHINPDVTELSYMAEINGEYNRYKSKLQAKSDEVLSRWKMLGKENFAKVQKFFADEVAGKELWFKLEKADKHRFGTYYKYSLGERAVAEFQKRGIDEETAQLILDAKNTLLNQLDEAEIALISMLEKRYAHAGQDVLIAAIKPIKREVQEIRKRVFFPQGRFGNRMLIVEQKKDSGPGWEIVWKEHFESTGDWEKAYLAANAKADGVTTRVRKQKLTDQDYVMMSLPLEFVDMAASELGLSDEQLDTLMNILQPVKSEKVLGQYEERRLGIKGYSSDAMRSFANYTWHNSNLLSKLIHRAGFNSAIRSVGSQLREAEYSSDPESLELVDRLQNIKGFMEKVRDYVMAPPNEAQQLRALVSIAYLGLNIKTALLNTYGLITTWGDITSRFGQLEGNKMFAKASLETFQSIKLLALNERREGKYLSPEKQQALDRALEEGVLSQSYAYHLAGMANAGNLQRLGIYQDSSRVFQGAIDTAMYVFRLTELSTRRASFLAEFEAARKNSNLSFEEAYQEAVTRTNKLQNDYSLGNRVPFMRGFKIGNENPLGKLAAPVVPLATVFMSFAQHMAFHAYGGYELGERRMAKHLGETPRSIWGGYTTKIWLVTLLLAGYEGLPGAENLIDLIEAAWRKYGGTKPVRQEMREFVQALEIDPELAARGLGHNVAGFDISRSVGFGRILPGTDLFAHPRGSAEEQFGVLALDLAGPTGGFIRFGLQAMWGDKSPAKTFERLPGGVGNIYVAYRWSQDGPRAPSGAHITHDLETGKIRDLTAVEIAGKALGFNPTVVSQNREVRFAQYDRQVYWQTRRQGLMQDLWTAKLEKDREAEADAKKAIVEYNASVPAEYRQLRLTGADIARSMQNRKRVMRFDEKQTTSQKKYRPLYEDVKESYDRP